MRRADLRTRSLLPSAALFLLALPAHAQARLPIIDMPLHALAANEQGPPPVGVCTPFDSLPTWDPAEPYGQTFAAILKKLDIPAGIHIGTGPPGVIYLGATGYRARLMFGSDQMVWPGVIERAIAVIEEAPFLGTAEKRDVLYHNAARFLRLGEEQVRRHHQR